MTQNIIILGTAVLWKEKNYYADKFHLWMWWWLWWSNEKACWSVVGTWCGKLSGTHKRPLRANCWEQWSCREKDENMAEKRSSWTLNESLVANYDTKDVRDSAVILARGCLGRSPGNNWEKDLQSKTVCSLLFEVQFDKPARRTRVLKRSIVFTKSKDKLTRNCCL